MTSLRAFARTHRLLVLVAIAMAIILRVAVPAGFMPAVDHGRIVITICSGAGPMKATMAIPGSRSEKTGDEGKAQPPCAFAGLSIPAIGGADPVILAVALAAAMVAALFTPAPLVTRVAAYLRPPLRGPPAIG